MSDASAFDYFVEELGPEVLTGTRLFAEIFKQAFQTDNNLLTVVIDRGFAQWEPISVGFNVALIASLNVIALKLKDTDPLLLNELQIQISGAFGGVQDPTQQPPTPGREPDETA